MLGHGDLGRSLDRWLSNLRILSPVPMERHRLWDEYQLALGYDGSVIDEAQMCFVLSRDKPLRTIKVEYPHGWNPRYGCTMIQTDPEEEDIPTDCLVASSHGYTANRMIHLVRHCRAFLRARHLRARHDQAP